MSETTIPRMMDMDGPASSRGLQIALVIGIGLLITTAGYGLISWGFEPEESLDTDNDGMPDSWELEYSGEPKVTSPDGRTSKLVGLNYNLIDSNADPDHDGLTNLQEFCWPLSIETCDIETVLAREMTLNPQNSDSDGDGIPDGLEIILCTRQMANGTRGDDNLCVDFSPLIASDTDVDQDGVDANANGQLEKNEELNSSTEIWFGAPASWLVEIDGLWKGGLDPLLADSDLDGIPDGVELTWQMDPLNFLDGVNDSDKDGFDGILTARDEWLINADSAIGGTFLINTSDKYISLRNRTTIMPSAASSIATHSSGSYWLGDSEGIQYSEGNRIGFTEVNHLLLHEGAQQGWLAVADSTGLSIIETLIDGNSTNEPELIVSGQIDDLTLLPEASGTTRLAFLTSTNRLGVLELSSDGSLISQWNASDFIIDLGHDFQAIEFSGEGVWIAVDSALIHVKTLDLLDNQPDSNWKIGPFSDSSTETPFSNLLADQDNEGAVIGIRGNTMIHHFSEDNVLDTNSLFEEDRGKLSALARSAANEWWFSTNEGIWSYDFNKHIDSRLSNDALLLSEVSTISNLNGQLFVATIVGNYSGIAPLDPRLNDSDGDGWIDGFELELNTDPTNPSDTFSCNGYSILCTRSFDDVVYPATHNSHANPESGFNNIAENQLANISTQLERGIRYINMDVYDYNGEVWVCHGDWDIPLIHPCLQSGGELAQNQLEEVADFLEDNPYEVVTLAFENYVNATTMYGEFNNSDLSPYLFSKQELWPTLGEMVFANTRLVVMADSENQGYDWWLDEHDETRMTAFSYQSDSEFDCENSRGNGSASMLQIAHYITDPISSEADAQLVNQFASLWRHAQLCFEKHGMLPNYILVDYADYGDAVLVAAVLNGVEEAPEGAFT
ncbi:hypothetical protein OAJ94_03845 [Deltaproteobacteria bacterium]|nr:hypothetical protein [Deltaproteobacteria bacterium]